MKNLRHALLCTVAVALAFSATPQAAFAKKPKQTDVTQPVVKLIDLTIDSVTADNGQLIANAVATLDIAGREVTQAVQIPLQLGATPAADDECDILNLSLGPVNLDLLGLVVQLDDCDLGPVTVDITAVQGDGLLGDLLCDVAGLLDDGLNLGSILDGLTGAELDAFTGGLRDVLNAVLADLGNVDTTPAASHAQAAQKKQNHVCDILFLEIPDGVHLALLGLQVDTSPICLDVHAVEARGNLLGNLLCDLTGLLDSGRGRGNSQSAHVRKIVRDINRLLDRLGL